MALTQRDFVLTADQLQAINDYFAAKAKQHAALGEDPADGVKVVFEWAPVYGRFVTVFFDGEQKGLSIEDDDTKGYQ